MAKRAPWLLVGSLLVVQTYACSSTSEPIAPQGASGGSGSTGSGASTGSGGIGGSGGVSSNTDANPGSGGTAGARSGGDAGTGGSFDAGPIGAPDAAMDAISDAIRADTPEPMLPPGVPAGYKLLLDQSFASAGSLASILAGNPADWTHGDEGGGFLQFGGVGYVPPNPPIPESFTSFALVSALKFGSFMLEVELMQRNPDLAIPQRDICIVFGIQSETQYYYAHIAQGHTDRWHNIHIIDNAPRRPITKTDNGGIMWGMNQWHKFRVVRDVATGDVAVFMDANLTAPILTATDTTFKEGYVGFATHQDSGRVRNLKVWGPSATAMPAPANFFTAQ
jgi:hypothetical protein